tara:strand:+ start:206 stop:700 length:495 start_codon:yes stop_codon:yes gene_type:complete
MKLSTPSSTLTRLANTTAYAVGDLVADHATAGSVTVPTLAVGKVGGRHYYIPRIRLTTDKTSGMGAINFTLRIWSSTPTYTNGDNGAWAVATNGNALLEEYTNNGFVQSADGAVAIFTPKVGEGVSFYLAGTQTTIAWDLEIESSLTPASAQVLTAIAEVYEVS